MSSNPTKAIELPDEVLEGFAEYGPNFFVVYPYTETEPGSFGIQEGNGIYCLSESPFSMKVSTQWENTPGANISKAMAALEEKFALIAQVVNKSDYSVILAGESTYTKYVNVDRISYTASVKLIKGNHSDDILSDSSEINKFLTDYALPLAYNNVLTALVNNVNKIVTDGTDRIIGIAKEIYPDDSKYLEQEKSKASISITLMYRTSKKIMEKVAEALSTFSSANPGVFKLTPNTSNDNSISLYLASNAESTYPGGSLGPMYMGTINRDAVLTVTHNYAAINNINMKDNKGNEAYDSRETLNLQNEAKQLFADIKCSNINEDILKNQNKSDNIEKLRELQKRINAIIAAEKQDFNNSSAKTITNISRRDSPDSGKFKFIAEGLINGFKEYGKFNHNIQPCVLFYSLCGNIVCDHVLISNWSCDQDKWGFTTSYNITMEKAEIDTFDAFCARILKPRETN